MAMAVSKPPECARTMRVIRLPPLISEGLRPSDSPTCSLAGTPAPRSVRVAPSLPLVRSSCSPSGFAPRARSLDGCVLMKWSGRGSRLQPGTQPLPERLRAVRGAANHENRVVAGDRAGHVRQRNAVEGDGQRLSLAGVR